MKYYVGLEFEWLNRIKQCQINKALQCRRNFVCVLSCSEKDGDKYVKLKISVTRKDISLDIKLF